MNLDILNRVSYLGSYNVYGEEEVLKEVLSMDFDLIKLSDSLIKEFKLNYIQAPTEKSIENLTKHYIIEMNEAFNFNNTLVDVNTLIVSNIVTKPLGKRYFYEYKLVDDDKTDFIVADDEENYILTMHELFMIIWENFCITCQNFNIDLKKLITELGEAMPLYEIPKHMDSYDFTLKLMNDRATYKNDSKIKLKPIYWLKSSESLRKFVDEIKKAKMIQDYETDDIIEAHFSIENDMPIYCPKPINWLSSISLLAYMIERLDKKFIKPDNLWGDIVPHFSKDGKLPQNMRQTANRYKNNKERKPKDFELVDDIMHRISA